MQGTRKLTPAALGALLVLAVLSAATAQIYNNAGGWKVYGTTSVQVTYGTNTIYSGTPDFGSGTYAGDFSPTGHISASGHFYFFLKRDSVTCSNTGGYYSCTSGQRSGVVMRCTTTSCASLFTEVVGPPSCSGWTSPPSVSGSMGDYDLSVLSLSGSTLSWAVQHKNVCGGTTTILHTHSGTYTPDPCETLANGAACSYGGGIYCYSGACTGVCTPGTVQGQPCTPPNGAGSQTRTCGSNYQWGAWSACSLTSCNAGYANCNGNAADGCEANLQSSASTCGSCTTACGAGGSCVSGTCRYTLAVTKSGTGSGTVTSSPAGINCGVTCSAQYNSGTIVTLTPTAAAGSTFSGWSGDADCSDGNVFMVLGKSCTTTFTTTPVGDTTPPTVGAITPTAVTVGDNIIFSAPYSDDTATSSCTFYADGTSQGPMTLSSPGGTSGTATRNTLFMAAGSHTAQARCTDAAGNTGLGPVTTITVSSGRTVGWAPGAGTTTAGGNVASQMYCGCSASAQSCGWIWNCHFALVSPPAGVSLSPASPVWNPGDAPIPVSIVTQGSTSPGTYTLTVQATSTGDFVTGVMGTAPFTLTVAGTPPPDTSPPDTTLSGAVDGNSNTVANGGTTASNAITFTFTGSDNVGVTGYECSLDGAAYAACTSPRAYLSLASGSHTFSVRAKDAAGNVDSSPASWSWTVAVTCGQNQVPA